MTDKELWELHDIIKARLRSQTGTQDDWKYLKEVFKLLKERKLISEDRPGP